MNEVFRNVSVGLVPDENTPVGKPLNEKSIFLKAAFAFNLSRVVGELAAGVTKGESLGHLWDDVRSDNGRYFFEIAAEVPYYLPRLDGKPEYCVAVNGAELFVCLRMTQCFYGAGDSEENYLNYVLLHRNGIKSFYDLPVAKTGVHPVPLKTFVTRRFEASEGTAEECIEKNLKSWQREFVSQIAHLIDAFRVVSPSDGKHFLPQLSTASFPRFWLAVTGGNGENESRAAQFASDIGKVAFRSIFDVTGDTHVKFDNVLQQAQVVPVHDSALSQARTFCHYGYFAPAIVQISVACESALSQAYRTFLRGRGVSNNKIKDNEKEISFSQLLNLHFYTMCDVSKLPDAHEVVGNINWVRDVRNGAVHEGRLAGGVTSQKVEAAIRSAEKLVQFVLKTD